MLSASTEDAAGYGVSFKATCWFALSEEQLRRFFKKHLLTGLVKVLFMKRMWCSDKMLSLLQGFVWYWLV